MLYRYEGAIYNGNVIYKKTVEYVRAPSKKQAITFLKVRLKREYPEITFIELKERNLHEQGNS